MGRSAHDAPVPAGSGAPGRRAGPRCGSPRPASPRRSGGDPPAESLLPELIDQIGQVLGREAVDQVGRGGAAGIGVEPHVQRPVGREAEPPALPGELVRRKAQIQEHPSHPIDRQFLQHPAHLGISRVDERHRKIADRLPGQFQHCRVPVQPDDPPGLPHPARQRRGMTSAADRPVEKDRALPRGQPGQHLIEQDGPMERSHGGSRVETGIRGRPRASEQQT